MNNCNAMVTGEQGQNYCDMEGAELGHEECRGSAEWEFGAKGWVLVPEFRCAVPA